MMTSEFVESIGNTQKDNENEFIPRNSGINHNFIFDKIDLKNEKINMNKNNDKKHQKHVQYSFYSIFDHKVFPSVFERSPKLLNMSLPFRFIIVVP